MTRPGFWIEADQIRVTRVDGNQIALGFWHGDVEVVSFPARVLEPGHVLTISATFRVGAEEEG